MTLTLERPSLPLLPSFRAALTEEQAEGQYLDLTPEALPAHIAALLARDRDVKPGRVPETVYWGVVGSEYVGRVSLRHTLNAGLEAWGGHIGYQVRLSRRGRGYGHALLVGVLPHARALGLERVLLHCDDANVASARVIEGAGGVFVGHTSNLDEPGQQGRAYWLAL